MKLNPDFYLRRIVDTATLVPFGKKMLDFNGMISLNKTGAFLAELLREDVTREKLVAAVVERFEVDAQTASKDVDFFLEQLRANGVLEE